MADELSLSIGPTGQPPVTTYTYAAGIVTLSPRSQTMRTVPEVVSIVARINYFASVSRYGQTPPVTPPDSTHLFRIQRQGGAIDCRYKCEAVEPQGFTVDASIDVDSKVVTFDARPQRSVSWSDFVSFVAFMETILAYARRC